MCEPVEHGADLSSAVPSPGDGQALEAKTLVTHRPRCAKRLVFEDC
jgi:hypothetical protein